MVEESMESDPIDSLDYQIREKYFHFSRTQLCRMTFPIKKYIA